jgi:hypothetical protein
MDCVGMLCGADAGKLGPPDLQHGGEGSVHHEHRAGVERGHRGEPGEREQGDEAPELAQELGGQRFLVGPTRLAQSRPCRPCPEYSEAVGYVIRCVGRNVPCDWQGCSEAVRSRLQPARSDRSVGW